MEKRLADCIVAPATALGPAERAVLRLSGPGLLEQAPNFSSSLFAKLPRKRVSVVRSCPQWGEVDVMVFPGPHSFTGEDVLELHLPGSVPLVRDVLDYLLRCGLRLAEPGEFTRRAFVNGRLDLTQSEAILDLIQSRTSADAEEAIQLLRGTSGKQLQEARDGLTHALVQVEVSLDFEEGDSQDLVPGEIHSLLSSTLKLLQSNLSAGSHRQSWEENTFRIGLLGAPNAGKTTLFRALTGEKGLVSSQPGTTRDLREGLWRVTSAKEPWVLLDAPGLGGNAVDARDEKARALLKRQRFDLVWWVVNPQQGVRPEEVPTVGAPMVVALTHGDTSHSLSGDAIRTLQSAGPCIWEQGDAEVFHDSLQAETQKVFAALERRRKSRSGARERHQDVLKRAIAAVEAAQVSLNHPDSLDCVAEDLRQGLWAMGELVGEMSPEDLLDRLFHQFCVGK